MSGAQHRSVANASTGIHQRLSAARQRYDGSWLHEVVAELKTLGFPDWTTIFGAELLWSALPFIILISSLGNSRVDDDLSRHIGLNARGALIVRGLFHGHPTHDLVALLTGLLFAFSGIMMVVGSLQLLYERAFNLDHRGWRDFPRYVIWLAVLLGALALEGLVNHPLRRVVGPVGQGFLYWLVTAIFFTWTMHFLLAGRSAWRLLVRPAIASAFLWLCLALFSSLYFSGVIIDDTRQYGTIGVVFTLLTWFVLIGVVIVLGAALGAVWQHHSEGRRAEATP